MEPAHSRDSNLNPRAASAFSCYLTAHNNSYYIVSTYRVRGPARGTVSVPCRSLRGSDRPGLSKITTASPRASCRTFDIGVFSINEMWAGVTPISHTGKLRLGGNLCETSQICLTPRTSS